ncbi:MAG: 30S ribosomal protein S2, partial [Phycisphaerae bacterium]
MASPLVREMLQAGIHFGHHCSRWNPKMKPYIYGRRNAIHVIDIRETLRGLLCAQQFVSRVIAGGSDVLFVGTKRQARECVKEQATRCGMHYVTERWLGGTLTNFRTIRSRLKRLEELEVLAASPRWETGYSKKMQSTLARELRKIQRNLNGIRNMTRLPGALIVIDVRKEINAVREAGALGIPTVCLLDTDSDPDFASIPIPGNDDSMRSIQLVVTKGDISGKSVAPRASGERPERSSRPAVASSTTAGT